MQTHTWGTVASSCSTVSGSGLLMKNFYRNQLAPIVRLADGGIAPN